MKKLISIALCLMLSLSLLGFTALAEPASDNVYVSISDENGALVGEAIVGANVPAYKQFVENCFKLIPRQSLHARALGFVHPTTGEYVQFESELPDDFKAVLQKWDTYTDAVGLDMDEI